MVDTIDLAHGGEKSNIVANECDLETSSCQSQQPGGWILTPGCSSGSIATIKVI